MVMMDSMNTSWMLLLLSVAGPWSRGGMTVAAAWTRASTSASTKGLLPQRRGRAPTRTGTSSTTCVTVQAGMAWSQFQIPKQQRQERGQRSAVSLRLSHRTNRPTTTAFQRAFQRARSHFTACGLSLQSSTTDEDGYSSSSPSPSSASSNKLDTVLSQLTNAFPFFVLSFATAGMLRPALLQWVNQGSLISVMLASVMCGTGLTLEQKDFTAVVQADWTAIPLGVACQFLIMPLAAFGVGRSLLLSSTVTTTAAASPVGPALFLGLLLVGCSPGGTASNLVSLIAQANVALSVLLTSVSTILAAVVTPLLVQFFVGSTVSVSGWALCQATAKVVLGPVLLGMVVNSKAPQLAQRVSRVTPFASVLLVSLICGGVVAQNASLLLSNATLLPRLAAAVLVLHSIGFAMGYWIPKRFFGKSEQTARTIAIETGMQNSALAVVLARSIATVGPLACVPGALSATAHSCLGSLLAAYWRLVDGRRLKQQEEERKNMMRTYTGDDEFDRGMMI